MIEPNPQDGNDFNEKWYSEPKIYKYLSRLFNLRSPSESVSPLQRPGVTFTDKQKALIEQLSNIEKSNEQK